MRKYVLGFLAADLVLALIWFTAISPPEVEMPRALHSSRVFQLDAQGNATLVSEAQAWVK